MESGLAPGTYVVRIFSVSENSGAGQDAMPGTQPTFVSRERIPPQYNLNSRLQCEVKEGEENVHELRFIDVRLEHGE